MKKKPWVPPPCKTSTRPSKLLSCSKRRSKNFLHHHSINQNYVGCVEKSGEYCQFFESDYLEVLHNLSSFKLMFYECTDKIQALKSKLNEKTEEISHLKSEIESEKLSRLKFESNCELLSNLVEKYETINNVQDEKIAKLELNLAELKQISMNLIDSSTSPKELKLECSSKSTQVDHSETQIHPIQTNFVKEIAEISTQTDSRRENIRVIDRFVQTDDNFIKDIDENKKKIKLLKAKLKSYKEKSLCHESESNSEKSATTVETLTNLHQNLFRLKNENQKLKECVKFLKESFRVLFVDS